MVRVALRAWNRDHETRRAVAGSGLPERYLGRCALTLCGFEQRRLLEAEYTGHLDGRKYLAPDVVVDGGVVERLPGEGNLVLSRGQLLLQGEHVLAGLEVRVRLGQGKEPAQRAAQLGLGLVKLPHDRRVAGVGGDFLLGRHRAVAGPNDGVERLPLVAHVAL